MCLSLGSGVPSVFKDFSFLENLERDLLSRYSKLEIFNPEVRYFLDMSSSPSVSQFEWCDSSEHCPERHFDRFCFHFYGDSELFLGSINGDLTFLSRVDRCTELRVASWHNK